MLFFTFICFINLILIEAFSDQDDRNSTVYNNKGTVSAAPPISDPVTVTPLGRIRGSWMQTRRGRQFHAYRGVRYAEPPVGSLRFEPPKPIKRYWEEVNATVDGPGCPMPAPPGTVDEDCLRLNVYTPDNNKTKRLPVIIFIHPGGFYTFSGRSTVFGPTYLLERDLVLVTINYRLGSLGFIATGDEVAPGNIGYKDQVAALRWVHNNIAHFGGDPNLVTITGCSAGAISVMLHLVSPMSKGLFHRAISLSGSPTTKVPLPYDLKRLAVRQAELVDCPTHSSRAIIECLRTKPWQQLGNSLPGFAEFGTDPVSLWRPNIEPDFGQERFLPIDPLDAIRENRIHAVPYIISMARNEFFSQAFNVVNNETLLREMDQNWTQIAPISFILPRDDPEGAQCLRRGYFGEQRLANNPVTARSLGRLYGDGITAFPVHRLANLMCRNSQQPVYYAEFDYIGNNSFYQNPVTGKPTGVAHQDDLLYLFPLAYRFPLIPLDSPNNVMVEKMTAIWYNFARYGDPNPRNDTPELQNLSWPIMSPSRREYLRIGTKFSVHQYLFEEYFTIWEEIYPLQYSYAKQHIPLEFSSKVLEGQETKKRCSRYVWDEVYPKLHFEKFLK